MKLIKTAQFIKAAKKKKYDFEDVIKVITEKIIDDITLPAGQVGKVVGLSGDDDGNAVYIVQFDSLINIEERTSFPFTADEISEL